ncbi:hypothetical protein GCM10009753_46600 [Streptantibioticus ferralitis]
MVTRTQEETTHRDDAFTGAQQWPVSSWPRRWADRVTDRDLAPALSAGFFRLIPCPAHGAGLIRLLRSTG